MAKKKRKSTIRRYVSKTVSRVRRAKSLNLMALATGSLIYGAARQKVSSVIAPYTSMIPLGNISDEVGMAAVNYVAYKKIRNKLVKDVARAGLTIEMARIGEAFVNGQVTLGALGGSQAVAQAGRVF